LRSRARVPGSDVARVMGLLDTHKPVDVLHRAASVGAVPATLVTKAAAAGAGATSGTAAPVTAAAKAVAASATPATSDVVRGNAEGFEHREHLRSALDQSLIDSSRTQA
jgi:hypothetical protein